jgi:hypothetical protein
MNYRKGNAADCGLFQLRNAARHIQAFVANQIASAVSTMRITPQTTGVTFFELPLRGESFGAWLNWSSIAEGLAR